MNMSHLAKKLGVSVATVSKAFSGSREISEKTREKIFAEARKCGCYSKYIEKYCDKPVIGVICPEFESGYYSAHLGVMNKEIEKRGARMIVVATEFDATKVNAIVAFFVNVVKVAGIITYSAQDCPDAKVPIVSIGMNRSADASISLSNDKAFLQAVEHFTENGHTKIAFIADHLTKKSKSRFEDILHKKGLPVVDEYDISTDLRFELAGYEVMNKLFECKKPPTAILAAYDSIAIGAMKCIYEHNKKIPDDISIIGMNDNRESKYLEVSLTTITSYNEDLGQIVVEELFSQIDGSGTTHKQIKLANELIKRGSVGKVKE